MHCSPRRWLPRPLLSALLLPLVGCYSHAVTSLDAVSPGQHVRVTVTPAAGEQISQLVGYEERTLEGELAEITDGAFYMTIPSGVRQEGFRFETLHQKLRFTQEDVVMIERRQLDRTRTALLVAGVGVAVTAVVLDSFRGKSGGDTRQPPGEPPSQVRIPWIRVTVP